MKLLDSVGETLVLDAAFDKVYLESGPSTLFGDLKQFFGCCKLCLAQTKG